MALVPNEADQYQLKLSCRSKLSNLPSEIQKRLKEPYLGMFKDSCFGQLLDSKVNFQGQLIGQLLFRLLCWKTRDSPPTAEELKQSCFQRFAPGDEGLAMLPFLPTPRETTTKSYKSVYKWRDEVRDNAVDGPTHAQASAPVNVAEPQKTRKGKEKVVEKRATEVVSDVVAAACAKVDALVQAVNGQRILLDEQSRTLAEQSRTLAEQRRLLLWLVRKHCYPCGVDDVVGGVGGGSQPGHSSSDAYEQSDSTDTDSNESDSSIQHTADSHGNPVADPQVSNSADPLTQGPADPLAQRPADPLAGRPANPADPNSAARLAQVVADPPVQNSPVPLVQSVENRGPEACTPTPPRKRSKPNVDKVDSPRKGARTRNPGRLVHPPYTDPNRRLKKTTNDAGQR